MTNLTVRELQQTEWSRWDEWLALQPWGSPFSSAWWLEANCHAQGGRPLLLGVFEEGELMGGVPLRVLDVGPLHMTRSSILYNPIVLAEGSPRGRQQVLCTLLDGMCQRGLIVSSLTCTPDLVDLRSAVWKGWGLHAEWTVVNDLSTWSPAHSVTGAKKTEARKAARAGVIARVEEPDAGLLQMLMGETMGRHATKVRGTQDVLKVLLTAAGSHGLFIVARDANGAPLCAGFVMFHGSRTAYAVWTGNAAQGLAVNAPALRCITALQEVQRRGFQYYDWCGGNLSGVSDFKLEFGGQLVTRLSIDRSPLWFKMALSARSGFLTARRAVAAAILQPSRLHSHDARSAKHRSGSTNTGR